MARLFLICQNTGMRLRFTLTQILCLPVLVGLVLMAGLWLTARQAVARRSQLQSEVIAAGGSLQWENGIGSAGLGRWRSLARPKVAINLWFTTANDELLHRLFDEFEVTEMHLAGSLVSDAAFLDAGRLGSLTKLDLVCPGLTNAGLQGVIDAGVAEDLCLAQSLVSDRGILKIGSLKSLVHLDLSYTHVSDVGLAEVARLPRLRTLVLNGTQITDGGLLQLRNCQSLESLAVDGTQVTADGLRTVCELPHLRLVSLESSTVPVADVELLRATYPHLTIEA